MSAPVTCLNCATPLPGGEFCPRCGQRNRHARLRVREILADTWQALADGDLPWWRTVRDLTLRPGDLVAAYVDGQRVSFVNPVKYCFIVVALALAFDALVGPSAAMPGRYYVPVNLWILVTVPALAALLRLAFLRGRRTYAEQLAYALYLSGHLTLATLLTEPLLFGAPDPQPVRFALALTVALVWVTHAGVGFNRVHAGYTLLAQCAALLVYGVLAASAYFILNHSIHMALRP